MRGLIVGFLLLFGSSPALSLATAGEAIRYAQHGNSDLADTEGGGHALGSGEIAPEEEAGEGGQCTQAAGSAGALFYYACRARTLAFGSVERAIVTFTALLARQA
jgi:hypothetical protein